MATPINNNIRIAGATNPPPDYTLVSLWEDDIPPDLVIIDEQWIANCYADWPTGLDDATTIVARTTSAINSIILKASAGSENKGIIGDGFFLKVSVTAYNGINIQCDYFSTADLEIVTVRSNSNTTCINMGGLGGTHSRNILRTEAAGVGSGITFFKSSNTDISKLMDCTVIGFNTGIRSLRQTKAYNNTLINNNYGFKDEAIAYNKEIKNNVAYNNAIADFDFAGSTNTINTNNASGDVSATGINSITGITSAEFVDAANNDYHLLPTSQLIGAGLNLITAGNLPSPQYDIDGDQWPDTGPWDIGYDHYISAGVIGKIYLGAAEITAMKLGGGDVIRAYLGNDQVFGSPV